MKRILAFTVCLWPVLSMATHLRGGHISVSQSASSLSCTITITLYTNLGAPIYAGNGELNFGDGSPTHMTAPAGSDVVIPPGVGILNISVDHIFPAPGLYTITYLEHNLDAGMINVPSSVEQPLLLETYVLIDPVLGSVRTPDFIEPIFTAFLHDTVRFSLAPINQSVLNYRYFYQVITNLAEGMTVPPDFTVDPETGSVVWNTRYNDLYVEGEFFFTVRISFYDENNRNLGHVVRAFQIILMDGSSTLATSKVNSRLVAPPGSVTHLKFLLNDNSDADSVRWKLYSEKALNGMVQLTQRDSTTATQKFRIAELAVAPGADLVRNFPYNIIVRGISFPTGPVLISDVNLQVFTKDILLPPLGALITSLADQSTEITVRPNPFNDYFYVDGFKSDIIAIEIIDLFGRPVQTGQFNPTLPVDGTGLAPGFYVVKASDSNRSVERKVIKR